MEHLRSFTVTYVPQTDTKTSRVKIYDNRFDAACYRSLTDIAKISPTLEVAREYLEARGIKIDSFSMGKKGYILSTRNFETQLK